VPRSQPGFAVLEPWEGPPPPEPPHQPWLSVAYGERGRCRVDTVVIHATAGHTSAGAMSRTLGQHDASWHVLIPHPGEKGHGQYAWRVVPDDCEAWHVRDRAKFSAPQEGWWPFPLRRPDVNSRSVGIEIVNLADGKDKYSEWQYRELAGYINYWRGRLPIRYVVTHAFLDPDRRTDPGPAFDWDHLLALLRHPLDRGGVQPRSHGTPGHRPSR